ncbi:unnamed protein product [Leptidea sinapis]|uniref:Uncharacterized protein n=1 Tax=Leptidea sinapis TaxID=189913 RepID=A0A5E4Q1E9_9NEOP|nr:unnamed protein product [Leptidea sinapis]
MQPATLRAGRGGGPPPPPHPSPPPAGQRACASRAAPAGKSVCRRDATNIHVYHAIDRGFQTIERDTIFCSDGREEHLSQTAKIASQVEMPSSLFGELGGDLVEDQRAFQLALELSMLNFPESLPSRNPLASPLGFAPQSDDRTKKSQNMTECVPVPSSEHVAEIVGRQDALWDAANRILHAYLAFGNGILGCMSTEMKSEVYFKMYLSLSLSVCVAPVLGTGRVSTLLFALEVGVTRLN